MLQHVSEIAPDAFLPSLLGAATFLVAIGCGRFCSDVANFVGVVCWRTYTTINAQAQRGNVHYSVSPEEHQLVKLLDRVRKRDHQALRSA